MHTVDYALDGHRALKILEAADRLSGTVTLAQAVDLVRGLKGGTINVQSRKKQGKETAKVDVVREAGAKVSLNADVSPVRVPPMVSPARLPSGHVHAHRTRRQC